MDKIEWIAPCHFGLESVLKREVEQLGYEIITGGRRQGYFSRRHAEAVAGQTYFCGLRSVY